MRKGIPAGSIIPMIFAFVLSIVAGACGQENITPDDITGIWRAVLESQGGEIPFFILISHSQFSSSPLNASVIMADKGWPDTDCKLTGNQIEISFISYPDSTITGVVSADGRVITGEWDPPYGDPNRRMPFRAERGVPDRFPPSQQVPADFSGTWAAKFRGVDGDFILQGEFLQQGDMVIGTFVEKNGRHEHELFQEGRVYGNEMRLSSFNGSQAFLFIARMQKDGTIEGEHWINESIYHGIWTATRWTADMGEPYLEMTHLASKNGRFPFSFPDVDGNIVSHGDARFAGKALIINVIDSHGWKSNEEAKFLVKLYSEYRERGLEIVSLIDGNWIHSDFEYKAKKVKRFAEINGMTWPLLMVGTDMSGEESEERRAADKILAIYPSTFFIGSDGLVKAVHTGFCGPDTGEYHEKLVEDFRARIEEILSTSAQ